MTENYAPEFRTVLMRAGITRSQAAALLHISPHTVDAWLKPESTKSANPAPFWAVELLALKTGVAIPPKPAAA